MPETHRHSWQYAESEVDFKSEGCKVFLYFACVCGTVKKVVRKELIEDGDASNR